MKISAKQYARSLYDLTLGKDENEVQDLVDKFFKKLVTNNNLGKFKDIIKEFSYLWDKLNNELQVDITSARQMSEESKILVEKYLKEKTDSEKINFTEKIDESILGGIILSYEDKVIDASLKSNLNSLKNKLK